MNLSRRSFLKSSGLLASGLTLGNLPRLHGSTPKTGEISNFGLQLYTLRDVITKDPQGVLRQVGKFGYRQIESYEGPQGMFWGMGHVAFQQFLAEHGMTLTSSHANVFTDFERKVEQAAAIGIEQLVCPWIGGQAQLDDYRKMADTFNELGRIANQAGIRFAYHNHGYTFEQKEGEFPQDILLQETDPALVDFQMDLYWVENADQRSIEWLKKYPGRFTTSHVKDMSTGDKPESTVLGTGVIDFATILRVGQDNGMKQFIVEQEAYTGTTPLDAVRENADYMRRLRI
jgi:sugar phosphate isomerase/epimerase